MQQTPFPSLTNAQGSFPNRKAQLRKGTPAPLQAQACCVHPLTRWRRKTHTSPLSLPGTSSPLCPLRENSNAKRWSQRPSELGRLREGGHASAQPGAGTRRSPRPPLLTAETRRRGRGRRAPASRRPGRGPWKDQCLLTFCRVARINTAPASESCQHRFP